MTKTCHRKVIRKLKAFKIPPRIRRGAAKAARIAEDAVDAAIEFGREHKNLRNCVVLGGIIAILLWALGVIQAIVTAVVVASLLTGLIIELKREWENA